MKGQQRIGAIVQARMSSRRLPGKSLRPLCGKPMLQYVLESLAQLDALAETIVATSTDPSDDPIAEFCGRLGSPCFRGPLDDVAERFLQASLAHGLTAFVRTSGDSPLLDARLVARAVALYTESGAHLATNVFPRTYPAGMSVEVVQRETFERVARKFSDPGDREHVTSYFYRHAEQFRIVNFASETPRRDVHLAVDTPEQFEFVARIVGAMNRPHWEYSLDDVLRLCDTSSFGGTLAPSQVRP
jgi:spore coat polysaccharide biosynthesis protein SpsF (cytidylyltransferase family)